MVCLLLFFPLADLAIVFSAVPATRFPGWQWLIIGLAAPVVTWGAFPFYRIAWSRLRAGTASMETLVSLGIISATAWSLYSLACTGVMNRTGFARNPISLPNPVAALPGIPAVATEFDGNGIRGSQSQTPVVQTTGADCEPSFSFLAAVQDG